MVKTDVLLFDPDRVCDSGQIFRMYRTEEDASVFLMYSGDRRLIVKKEESDVFFECSDEEYETYWKHYLDMDRDYEVFHKQIDPKDRFLVSAYEAGRGLRILNQDLFEMIVSFIISQQKQIPSIRKCVEALCERFGERHVTKRTKMANQYEQGSHEGKERTGICTNADEKSWYGFPSPRSIAAAGPDGLKGLSLGYRERYIYETSCRFIEVERELRDAVEKRDFVTTKKILMSMTGIGEKVADCILLFACGDLDAFPVDTHIISILEREYPAKKNCKAEAKCIGPQGNGKKNVRKKEMLTETTGVEKLTPAQARERAREVFGRYKGFSGLVQQWIFAYELMLSYGKK